MFPSEVVGYSERCRPLLHAFTKHQSFPHIRHSYSRSICQVGSASGQESDFWRSATATLRRLMEIHADSIGCAAEVYGGQEVEEYRWHGNCFDHTGQLGKRRAGTLLFTDYSSPVLWQLKNRTDSPSAAAALQLRRAMNVRRTRPHRPLATSPASLTLPFVWDCVS